MASSGYPNPLAVAAILERLGIAKATEHHQFWPDDISVTDGDMFNRSGVLGPKQITDRYLLTLAVRNGGRLVTFDQGMQPTVARVSSEHLVQLQG